MILLPVPTLTNDRNVHKPQRYIASIARSRGQSVAQTRREAINAMRDWVKAVLGEAGRYTERIG